MTSLPEPTGPYALGTVTHRWVDPNRRDIFDGQDARPRELMVQLWYPAEPAGGADLAPYVEEPRTLEQLALLMKLPHDAFAHLGDVHTHAVPGAPVAGSDERFPVLLFSHGRCGVREHNTIQVEELVSHGYVVVTVDHTHAASGVSFPDGRLVEFDPRLLPPWPRHAPDDPTAAWSDSVIPYLADDLRFVLRQVDELAGQPADAATPAHPLAGRLDLDRIGVFGVSLGGVVAAEACAHEPRFAALLSLDAYVPADALAAGLRQPAMWITRDAATMRREGWDEYDVSNAHRSMRAAFEALPGEGYIVLVPGMYHIDFSDGRVLSPLIAERGISGPIDGDRAMEIIRSYSVAFFDRHVRAVPAPLLDDGPVPAPDLAFERRRRAVPAPVAV